MEIVRVPCHKLYPAGDHRVRPVEVAVAHWTASPPKGPGLANRPRIEAWLANPDVLSSTGFVILRDGLVLQAAELGDRTWHAGGSVWRGPVGVVNTRVNASSIGFDLENVGPLTIAPDGNGFVDAYGGRYKGAAPTRVGKKFFEPYTDAQLHALDEFVRWLAEEVPVLRDPRRWTGHQDIMKTKLDPGPLFPWAAVRQAVAAV